MKSLLRRFERGAGLLDAFVLVSCARFSWSFVNDVIWYGTSLERALRAVLLALGLSGAWLLRPGVRVEGENGE